MSAKISRSVYSLSPKEKIFCFNGVWTLEEASYINGKVRTLVTLSMAVLLAWIGFVSIGLREGTWFEQMRKPYIEAIYGS